MVIDTNVLVSALLSSTSPPAELVALWRVGRFTLLTAAPQLEELTQATRYPRLRARLTPALAGRLVNELRDLAETVDKLPLVDVSPDPYDNYLLAIASGGRASSLITEHAPSEMHPCGAGPLAGPANFLARPCAIAINSAIEFLRAFVDASCSPWPTRFAGTT